MQKIRSIYLLFIAFTSIFAVNVYLSAIAIAQAGSPEQQKLYLPDRGFDDENGINIVSAIPSISIQDVNIGGSGGLANTFSASFNCFAIQSCPHFRPDNYMVNSNGNFMPSFVGGLLACRDDPSYLAPDLRPFSFNGVFDVFRCPNGTPVGIDFPSFEGNSGVLKFISASTALYTSRDGDKYYMSLILGLPQADIYGSTSPRLYPVTRVEYASGLTLDITYAPNVNVVGRSDIVSVVRNDGYALKYSYANGRLIKTTGVNLAYDNCIGNSQNCNASFNWPTGSYTWSTLAPANSASVLEDRSLTVTHPGGEQEKLTMNFQHKVLKHELASGETRTYDYCKINVVTGGTLNCQNFYGGLGSSPYLNLGKISSFRSNNNSNVYIYKAGEGALTPFNTYDYYKSSDNYQEDQENFIFGFSNIFKSYGVNYTKKRDGTQCWFDGSARNNLNRCELDGMRTSFSYDDRNNVIKKDRVPRGGGLTLSQTATYPSLCSEANQKICNKPTSETDESGGTTLYTYAEVHGGLLTKTSPPDSNGIRPQIRYSYIQRNARDVAGNALQPPIWLLAGEKYCRTTNTVGDGCAGGTADEVVTTYEYGSTSGPNNLHLRGRATTDGLTGQTLRTCFGYDRYGNRISETQPEGTGSVCS
jgi:hypothetical protein